MNRSKFDIRFTVLFLSEKDIQSLSLSLSDLTGVIERAHLAASEGRVKLPSKQSLKVPGSAAFFHAMPAVWPEATGAGLKWVGGSPENRNKGLPHIFALMILSDAASGAPLAIIAASGLTAVRTAAVTQIAARRLALPESRRVAFVGCGLQARSHLDALLAEFPLSEVRACSRTRGGAVAFAELVRTRNLAVHVCQNAREALEGADIVISSVPSSPALRPFLRVDWLKPGAFASLVDLGRSWQRDGLSRLDRLLTDDQAHSERLAATGHLDCPRDFDDDLGGLIAGRTVRSSPDERIGFLHPGTALADLAAADLVYRTAVARGVGTMLPIRNTGC